MGFDSYTATKKLKLLAEKQVDLTDPKVLTKERLEKFVAKSVDLTFLYGTEKISDEVLQELKNLADEADVLKKIKAMQDGEIINKINNFPSENRRVLHTATRDFFNERNNSEDSSKAAIEAYAEIEKLKIFLKKIENEPFTDLIMIGIGGSDLGPRAHYIALEHLKRKNRNVHFISNVDPDDAASVVKKLDLRNTLVVCVSKSGNTLETETNEEIVYSFFSKKGLQREKHFIAVTGKGSPMDNPKKYKEIFYIWDWIGGRYSTTSMVGGVMLSFVFGLEVFLEFLEGAHEMDIAALNPDLNKNIPLLGALLGVWNRNFLGLPTVALIPYSQSLLRFPAHVQQLDMESNGKQVDKEGVRVDYETGPIIWGEPGTNAQHSFFQLIHQGTSTIPLEFIGFKECSLGIDLNYKGTTSQEKLLANLFAQSLALAAGKKDEQNLNKNFPGNRPSHILLAKKLTPKILGQILSYFENKVAFQGFIWNINSFDQEGVQLGKVLAIKIIEQFADRNNKDKQNDFALGTTMLSILDKI